MQIEDLLPDRDAIIELRATSPDEALGELADHLAPWLGVEPALLRRRFAEREALGSTGIGHGLALPHAKLALTHTHAVLGLARGGVEFDAIDGEPVRVFVALASPATPQLHLEALACVGRVFADPGMIDAALACASSDELLALLHG